MGRQSFTTSQKLAIVQDANQRLANGESLRSIGRLHNVQGVQIRKWQAMIQQLARSRRSSKSLNKGRPGRLQDLEEEIMTWALEMRDAGVPLSYKHLVVKACELNVAFNNLPSSQQYHTIRRLCLKNSFRIRRITHMSQTDPAELVIQAQQWLDVMRPIVSAPNVQQPFVLNMDQTPMYLSMAPLTTLNIQGESTVNGRKTSESGTRFTVSVTIAANGDKLKPYLIFKGERNGRIAQRELPVNPNGNRVVLCCQKKAWQDETNMVDYIDRVLVPYLQERAVGVPCILLLDQFSAHWTETVRDRMEDLGITPYKIPAGCTAMVQPVDVGIGKPFKDRVRSKWWSWMLQQGADRATFVSASRQLGSSWVADSWDSIQADTVRNAWRKSHFSYFVDED
jgi:hypothetical protein